MTPQDDICRRGMTRAEARRKARLEFGAPERYKDECRESSGLRLFDELRADLLYTARTLRKSPGFAGVVVLSLALGIGANTAIFSVLNGILLRPLPFRDQDRLVSIDEEMPRSTASIRAFRALPLMNVLLQREHVHSVEDMAALQYAVYQLIDVTEPEELRAGWVTANMCPFLGIQPVIGRCFTSEDEKNKAPVTMPTYGLWRRQFGGDPGIVGKPVALRDFEGNKRFTVIGVIPQSFQLIQSVDLLMPLSESRNYRERNSSWSPSVLIARLKPRIQPAQARAELLAMQRRMFPSEHEGAGGLRIVVLPVAEYLARQVKTGLLVLFCVVTLVLLITCANVANLILSRDAGRLREIAVRTSLGAARLRICRQLMTEALTLSLGGGLAGLAGSYWMVKGVKELAFARLPRVDDISIDWMVLAFTALISVASGLLFGLLPAIRLSRVDLATAMKAGGAGAIGGRHHQRVMNGLVVFEVALCAAALMSAGLLINTFIRLKGIDPGFRSDRLLVASLNSQGMSLPSTNSLYNDVLVRVRSIPGVEAATLTNYPPPYHIRSIQNFRRPEKSDVAGTGGPRANARVVSPGYFRTMGIRLLRGRDLEAGDAGTSRRAVVISSAMAHHYWPGEEPIGRTILLQEYRKEVAAEIVGVVSDVRQVGLRDEPEDQMYFSYAQVVAPGGQTLIVRAAGNPQTLAEVVKREIRAVDRNQSPRMTTMDKLLAAEVAEPRFYMIMLGAYGGLALTLTTLGIGGLVVFSVTRRRREIGLRISFGATRRGLLRMFATANLKLVVAGLMIGMPVSWGLSRYARTLLFEVTPTDPTTIALVLALLAGVSLAVSVATALRATTIEPASVLRHE